MAHVFPYLFNIILRGLFELPTLVNLSPGALVAVKAPGTKAQLDLLVLGAMKQLTGYRWLDAATTSST